MNRTVVRKRLSGFILSLIAIISFNAIAADDTLHKPFILASTVTGGNIQTVLNDTKTALTKGGFTIAGEFSPYEKAHVIIVHNKDLLRIVASESNRAAYAAAQRVSVTENKGQIQVAYTNPVYMSYAYRMKNDLHTVRTALSKVLGSEKEYGAEGLKESKLREYNYAWGMEEFDEPDALNEYDSHAKGKAVIDKGFKTNKVGAYKVYQIEIPGKSVTLYGVGFKSPNMFNKYQDDSYIMGEIDFKDIRSTAHLPHELLLNGTEAEALNSRFRIAMNFPDLSMAGKNSFMNIMGAPGGIYKAMLAIAGGKDDDEF